MVKYGDIIIWDGGEHYEVRKGDILYAIESNLECPGYSLERIQKHIEEGDCYIQTYEIY